MTTSALDTLQAQIAAVLHDVPGAVGVYLFGSRLTAPHDPYADLDLQVVTNDPVAARSVWPQILGTVAPIESVWPITAAPDNTAYAVQFQHSSLYHKVDIGLSPLPTAGLASALPAQARWLWQHAPRPSAAAPPPITTYYPQTGSVGHALLGHLMGGVRYCKARKRGHGLTCWRFGRSAFDTLLQLRFEHMNGWTATTGRLGTWDYKRLDGALSAAERTELQRLLAWSTAEQMDACFLALLRQASAWFGVKAQAQQEALPLALVDRYLGFIALELGTDGLTDMSM